MDAELTRRALRDFTTLQRSGSAHCGPVRAGAYERLYFVRSQVPTIVDNDGEIIHRVHERLMPSTSPVQTDLIRLVREELRPAPDATDPPAAARASRIELTEAITHRPQSRAGELGL